MLGEWFRLFERFGWIYEQRLSAPQWKRYPTESLTDRRKACLNALLLFLEGYAFERAGRPPYFSGLAVDVLSGIGTWPPDQHLVWRRFRFALSRWKQDFPEIVQWDEPVEVALPDDQKGLNAKVNPLAPLGTRFYQKGMPPALTTKESIVQLAARLAAESEVPLDIWVRDRLQKGIIQTAHSEFTGVSGIGDKIASLFMRDVACRYGIPSLENEDARKLLQPIDIWERRTVQLLRDGERSRYDRECQTFIVRKSIDAGCSPERVNQGIWYFGSQIAGTEYFLQKAIASRNGIQTAKNWLEAHMTSMDSLKQIQMV